MFNRSMKGARVTAILYTICVSCAMNGVDPKTYLRETILRIRNCRGFQLRKRLLTDGGHFVGLGGRNRRQKGTNRVVGLSLE